MIEIWKKANNEFAAKLGSGEIVSAPDARRLVAKLERRGISTQPVRLTTGDSGFTQWSSYENFLRGVCAGSAA